MDNYWSLKLDVDTGQIERIKRVLSGIPGAFAKAQNLALQRTIDAMRSDYASLVTERYYIKRGEVRKSFMVRRSENAGELITRGKRKSLMDYKVTPTRPGKRGTNYKGAVKRTGLKSLGKAFMIKLGKAGKNYIYYRHDYVAGMGDKWYGISAFTSPAVPQDVHTISVEKGPEIMAHASDVFARRLQHEAWRILGVIK